ncbi:tRNA ribosyltransferase-isomerase (Queuosine biosynthesis protein QueA) [Alteracholeplasma palmae J233]|uniref:S-adenosylmethionine:tRNA ribosyltransferase-isomerase n=1 Tax=Alteracholeplasma palmae (strain ATCC 49389 / J233) TaxID=1318466 RepID=U4KKF2_ALTPJ|nr:tRNA preQ1(34) S-adenosylmethionine ribosyltransferase-isomerase QueA [Alteracholeplasma palmae]CCV64077.1 tRNA ribosyltransferase-isomerase (Queuosine biosynthesis protein QueA) [Alteracholeplasma palmae J233]
MNTNDFDFNLPEHLIAQHPSEKRDNSRLMVLNRKDETIEHKHFYDIIDYLDENSCLVINDTKVLPARLLGIKKDTHAAIEVLLLKELEKDVWEALTKPAKRVKVGTLVTFGDGLLELECIDVKEDGIRHFKLHYKGILIEVLEKLGTMPLPPYIVEKLDDQSRYQTVYADVLGSSAAPTAGLHFTKELLEKIKQKGIEIIPVTLHVGLGTFRPVSVENVLEHHMHEETYILTEEVTEKLNQAVLNKKTIVAVGTTSVRTLESNFDGKFHAGKFDTKIFIYPGYKFKVVNQLITNFHLPKSTLMMLISAFATKEYIKKAYSNAIDHEYRFFSFGDSMFIK